jgi:hypothetical protein
MEEKAVMKENCSSCKFHHKEGGGLFCRRKPPIVFLLQVETMGGIGTQLRSHFPPVTERLYCGEYQPDKRMVN